MMVFMVPVKKTPLLTQCLKEKFGQKVRLTNSNPYFIDVLNLKASKGKRL